MASYRWKVSRAEKFKVNLFRSVRVSIKFSELNLWVRFFLPLSLSVVFDCLLNSSKKSRPHGRGAQRPGTVWIVQEQCEWIHNLPHQINIFRSWSLIFFRCQGNQPFKISLKNWSKNTVAFARFSSSKLGTALEIYVFRVVQSFINQLMPGPDPEKLLIEALDDQSTDAETKEE